MPVYSGETTTAFGTTSTTSTLVEVNGTWALVVVALPLVPVIAVFTALRSRRRHHRAGAGPVALTVLGVLGAFAFVTGFTIGVFVVPIVVLVAIACATTEARGAGVTVPSNRD